MSVKVSPGENHFFLPLILDPFLPKPNECLMDVACSQYGISFKHAIQHGFRGYLFEDNHCAHGTSILKGWSVQLTSLEEVSRNKYVFLYHTLTPHDLS